MRNLLNNRARRPLLASIRMVAWLSALLINTAQAEPQTLTLAVNSPGTPPHLYFNEEQHKYDGVIPELLSAAEKDGVFIIEYVDSNRSRNEFYVATGKFDMFYSSMDWVNEPEQLISTIPIFQHTSYLYSMAPFPADFQLNAGTRAKVCARRGFTYPGLEPWFKKGNLIRIDTSSHQIMLDMLMSGRCELAELNSKNMMALQKVEKFKDQQFFRYDEPTSLVPASLILNPARKAERDILNTYIRDFLESGRYEPLLRKHLENL